VIVLEDLDDVGMPGEAQRLRFPPKAVRGDHVVGHGGAQELDGDRSVVRKARGLMDDAARAGAQLAAEAILARDHRPFEEAHCGFLALLFERHAALEGADPRHLRVRLGFALLARLPRGRDGAGDHAGPERRPCAHEPVGHRRHGGRRRGAEPHEDVPPRGLDLPREHVVLDDDARARRRLAHFRGGGELHAARSHAEHGGYADELRGARQRPEAVALVGRIVRDGHPTVPASGRRRRRLPPECLGLVTAERIEPGERSLGPPRASEDARPHPQVLGVDHPGPSLAERLLAVALREESEGAAPGGDGQRPRLVGQVLGIDLDLPDQGLGRGAVAMRLEPQGESLDARCRRIAGGIGHTSHAKGRLPHYGSFLAEKGIVSDSLLAGRPWIRHG
jgi:hypothetical protein